MKVGDYVWIGPARPEKTTWTITSIHQAAEDVRYATVRSGLSGQSRVVPLERLVLHSRGKSE